MKKYLVALPVFPNSEGFCHITVLVKAKDKNDAIAIVKHIRPDSNIGEIKEVTY